MMSGGCEDENPIPKWAKRAIFAGLLCMDFFGFACYSVMGPFFPTEAQRKGVSQTVTGLVFSSYAITMFVFAPLWGHYISKSGPKLALVGGGSLCGIANILFGTLTLIKSTPGFIAGCFIVRIIEGIGFAAFNTGVFATMGRLYPQSLGSAMSFVEIAIGVGMGLGPAIGSALYAMGGYTAPFVFLGCFVVLTSGIVYLLITTIPSVEAHLFDVGNAQTDLTLWKMIRIPSAVFTLISIFICGYGLTFLMPILAIHILEIGIEEETSGYVFSSELGVYAVLALIVGKLSDKYPLRRFTMITFGLFVSGISYLIVGPSPIFSTFGIHLENTLATNLAGLILLGIGGAFVLVPTYQTLLDSATNAGFPDNAASHGIVGGGWNAAYILGDMTGPASGAAMTDKVGYGWATTFCAIITLAFASVMSVFTTVNQLRRRRVDDSYSSPASEKLPFISPPPKKSLFQRFTEFRSSVPN